MTYPPERAVPSMVLSVLSTSNDVEVLRSAARHLTGAGAQELREFAAVLNHTGSSELLWRDVAPLMPDDVVAAWFVRFGTREDLPLVASSSADLGRFVAEYVRELGSLCEGDVEVWDFFAQRLSSPDEAAALVAACMGAWTPGSPMPYPVRAVLDRVGGRSSLSLIFSVCPQVIGFAAEVVDPPVFLAALDDTDLVSKPPTRAWSWPPNAAAMDVVIAAAASVVLSVTVGRAASLAISDPPALWERLDRLVDVVAGTHGPRAVALLRDELDPPLVSGPASGVWPRCSALFDALCSEHPPEVSAVVDALVRNSALAPHVCAAAAFYAGASHPSVPLPAALSDVLDSKLAKMAPLFVSGMLAAAPRPADQLARVVSATLLRTSTRTVDRTDLELVAPVTLGGMDALVAAVANRRPPGAAASALVEAHGEGLLTDAVIAGLHSTVLFGRGSLLPITGSGEVPEPDGASFATATVLARWFVEHIGVRRLELAAALASPELTLFELVEVLDAATGPATATTGVPTPLP